MPSSESDTLNPITQLTARAERRYGVERARKLADQLGQLGASIAAVRAYPLANADEPWIDVPEIQPSTDGTDQA